MIWDKQSESPWSDLSGKDFYTYPNSTVVPYVKVLPQDISAAPTPLWITDIHPNDPLGIVVKEQPGTYWIDLPLSFESYIDSLQEKYRKKFLKNLKTNSDLQITENKPNAIDSVWNFYVDRLNQLAARNGAENYTEEELSFRYGFYTQKNIETLSLINPDGEVAAVNISLWQEQTVFDLACIINPTKSNLTRSLGTFAILKNIEIAINKQMKIYDLLANDYGYKSTYGAKEYKLKSIIIADDDFFDYYQIPLYLKYSINI